MFYFIINKCWSYCRLKVRGSSVPFGGVFILGTGDFRQLPPPSGDLVWIGTQMFTTLNLALMKCLVRAMDDPGLQVVIETMGMIQVTAEKKKEFFELITDPIEGCHFVKTWEDVPDGYMKIVSKRVAVREAMFDDAKILQEQLRKKNMERSEEVPPRGPIRTEKFTAEDEVENSVGIWVSADSAVIRKLSRLVREPEEMILFEGAKIRFTMNDSRFSQGQVGQVIGFLQSGVDGKIGVEIRLANPGSQSVSSSARLIVLHKVWTPGVVVGKGFMKARRKQLPVVPDGFTTVHKCIGQTHDGVAIKLSLRDRNYKFWLREQLLVSVSRVRARRNIYLVGEELDIKSAMSELLDIEPRRWREISVMVHLTDMIGDGANAVVSHAANVPLLVHPTALPDENIGYVYFLAAHKHQEHGYVGETKRLRTRLLQHNSPCGGSVQTNIDFLKPFIVLAYVCGFSHAGDDEQNKRERKEFERVIGKRKSEWEFRFGRMWNSIMLRDAGKDLVLEWNATGLFDLRFIYCASFESDSPSGMSVSPRCSN